METQQTEKKHRIPKKLPVYVSIEELAKDNGESIKDYIKHKLEIQRKELIEEFEKILNEQIKLETIDKGLTPALVTLDIIKQRLKELEEKNK